MFGLKRDQHEFKPLLVEIEDEPLNPLGRLIFWAVVLALLLFALWMYFGKIDVVVTARGKVIPAGEVKTIQPLTTGVLRSIRVRTGQLVEEGEVLMEIDPADTEPELASQKADLHQSELEILRIEALLAGKPFSPPAGLYNAAQLQTQATLYQSSRSKLASRVQIKRDQLAQIAERRSAEEKTLEQSRSLLAISRQRLERLETVRDLVSQDDYEQALADVTTYAHGLLSSQHKLEELNYSSAQTLEEISLIEEEERNQLLRDLAGKRQESLYLQAKIDRTEFINARQQICAPVRGHVSQLLVHTIGGVVTPAQKLAVLVPVDSPLVIKTQVLNKDVGYLSSGMETAIKVDTFEFQKYGMLRGRLLQIARDSMEDEQLGVIYEAYVEPLETILQVDGKATPLTTGMTVSAEIKVGQRRIIEFFLYPLIKYLDEGVSVR